MANQRRSRRIQGKLRGNYSKTFLKLFAKQFYEVHRGKPFDFKAVTRVMIEITKRRCDLVVFWQYMKIAFELMEFFGCRDARIVCQIISFKYNPFPGNIIEHGAVFNTEKLMEMPYSSTYDDDSSSVYNPVFSEVLSGHGKAVERLLRYGLICPPPFDKMSEWLIALNLLESYTGLQLKPTAYFYRWDLDHNERRRTLMVLRAIRVLVQNSFPWQNSYLNSVRCFKMVFETIPECYITRGEVENCLQHLAEQSVFNDNLISCIGERFEQHFPSSKGPVRPRSLKHLSRCQIRQCMREAHTLWYGVEDLQIPVILQEYINPKL